MSEQGVPMMDRPAYELVRLIEAALDDADQTIDTPQKPNRISVWGVRMLLEPYGGKRHRWEWPHCFECDHQMPLHNYGPCDLCGCPITAEEIADGARDEALDEAIEQALCHDLAPATTEPQQGQQEGLCVEFVETGDCGHTDAEHDAMQGQQGANG